MNVLKTTSARAHARLLPSAIALALAVALVPSTPVLAGEVCVVDDGTPPDTGGSTATGSSAFACGLWNTADGSQSTSIGSRNEADGDSSVAIGAFNITEEVGGVAIG